MHATHMYTPAVLLSISMYIPVRALLYVLYVPSYIHTYMLHPNVVASDWMLLPRRIDLIGHRKKFFPLGLRRVGRTQEWGGCVKCFVICLFYVQLFGVRFWKGGVFEEGAFGVHVWKYIHIWVCACMYVCAWLAESRLRALGSGVSR